MTKEEVLSDIQKTLDKLETNDISGIMLNIIHQKDGKEYTGITMNCDGSQLCNMLQRIAETIGVPIFLDVVGSVILELAIEDGD